MSLLISRWTQEYEYLRVCPVSTSSISHNQETNQFFQLKCMALFSKKQNKTEWLLGHHLSRSLFISAVDITIMCTPEFIIQKSEAINLKAFCECLKCYINEAYWNYYCHLPI